MLRLLLRSLLNVSILMSSLTVSAEPAVNWKSGVLDAFRSSKTLSAALQNYIDKNDDNGQHLALAEELLRHLEVTGLRFSSIEEFVSELTTLLNEQTNSPLAKEHLVWMKSLLDSIAESYPYNVSIKQAQVLLNSILERSSISIPETAFRELMMSLLQSHSFEQKRLEDAMGGISIQDSRFWTLAYQAAQNGSLADSFKRLMLGKYLSLRSIFSPTARQIQERVTRQSHVGGSLEIRTARRYANTRNFIRNGWSPEDDHLRIAIGSMQERVFRVDDINTERKRAPEAGRNILMLVDITSSMFSDNRGLLRNLLVSSYIDQIFTKATQANEKINLYVIGYGPTVGAVIKVSTREEAYEVFRETSSATEINHGEAQHADAMIAGIDAIVKDDAHVTHLNIVLVTDGEEGVDVSKIKNHTNKLKVGREGIRFGFSAIALVKGHKSINKLAEQMNDADPRFTKTGSTIQFFDYETMKKWTQSEWAQEAFPQMTAKSWQVNSEDIRQLGVALYRINFNEAFALPAPIAAQQDAGSKENSGQENQNQNNSADDKNEQPKEDEDDQSMFESDEGVNSADEKSNNTQEDKTAESLNSKNELNNHSDDKVKKDKPALYSLRLLRGRLPKLLLVPQRDNLPKSLKEDGFKAAVDKRDLWRVRIINNAENYSLSVKAILPTIVSHRMAPIAKPEGFVIVSLHLMDIEGNEIKDFDVYEIAQNGMYIVRFNKSLPPKNTFFYEARYLPEPNQKKRPTYFNHLNGKALKTVSEQMRSDRLTFNADILDVLASQKGDISVEDVAQSLKASATYTFIKQNGAIIPTGGRFQKYQKFLRDSRLHYQCNAANPLLADIFNAYAIEVKKPTMIAETVGGYAIKGLTVDGSTGHAVTYLRDSSIMYSYIKLDSTPSQMDESAKKVLLPPSIIKRAAYAVSAATRQVIDKIDTDRRARSYLRIKYNDCKSVFAKN